MSIICKIDNRERDLIKLLQDNNINITTQNLDIGDIQIIYLDNNDVQFNLVTIERKTYDDLSTSIKDGRYKEQKNRILNSISSNTRKIYLLEGNNKDFKLSKNVLEGTIINTIVRDNIHIFISKNINDTINFITNIMKNINKYKENIINNKNNIETNNVLISTSKKSNMNSETCFTNMLSGIPGISKKTSTSFIDKYKNINGMFQHFHVNLNNKKELIISDLENMKVGENKRKLGNKNAERVYKFLFN
jgi:ERCC4-type nuclease